MESSLLSLSPEADSFPFDLPLAKENISKTCMFNDPSPTSYFRLGDDQNLHYAGEDNTYMRAYPTYDGGHRLYCSPPIIGFESFRLQFGLNRKPAEPYHDLHFNLQQLNPANRQYRGEYDMYFGLRKFDPSIHKLVRAPYLHCSQSLSGYACAAATFNNAVCREFF